MVMEIVLSEIKAKEYSYTIDECYDELDMFFSKIGMNKLEKGVYYTDDFGNMGIALVNLSKCNWFINVVDQWFSRYENDDIDDRENCLEAYYKYRHIINE